MVKLLVKYRQFEPRLTNLNRMIKLSHFYSVTKLTKNLILKINLKFEVKVKGINWILFYFFKLNITSREKEYMRLCWKPWQNIDTFVLLKKWLPKGKNNSFMYLGLLIHAKLPVMQLIP